MILAESLVRNVYIHKSTVSSVDYSNTVERILHKLGTDFFMAKEREICFGPLLRNNNADSIIEVLWLYTLFFSLLSLSQQFRMLDECQFKLIYETKQKRE